MGRLAGKVAIITGAANGIGAATARIFAAEGAITIIADIDVELGEALAKALAPAAHFARHDVCSENDWAKLIDAILARHGRLDILVNNAGVVEIGTPESISATNYHRIMGVSVEGTIWGCKYAIPAMRKNGSGAIVNMASIASVQGEPIVAAYSAAKGAVEAYSRSVAVYCAQQKLNIRCNSVHPSGIDTPMVQSLPEKMMASSIPMEELASSGAGANPLGRAEDIAQAILFLASDESRFVNGQRLIVDNTASVTEGIVPTI